MAAAPWWKDPVTQQYNPPVEPGEDIGTPFHTPITALLPGSVAGISYGGYGARVDVMTAQGDVYYQHLDTVATGIRKGASVSAGQDIGLSGGQLWGGQLPNSPLNSTGPHVEVGVVYGARSQDPSSLIAGGPQGPAGVGGAPAIPLPGDPTSWLNAGAALGGTAAQAGGGGALISVNPQVNFPNPFAGLAAWTGSTTQQVGDLIKQNIIPLVVAAIIIVIVLGTGQSQPKPQPPQIIPVPV